MNPSTRLLPFGRANSIHFFQKYRRVSSSTKTTHPRDPAKSSHFRRKMAQHKREKPKQAGRPAQPASLTHRVRELQTRKTISGRAQTEESQTGSPKLYWQAQAKPVHKSYTLEFQTSRQNCGVPNIHLYLESTVLQDRTNTPAKQKTNKTD